MLKYKIDQHLNIFYTNRERGAKIKAALSTAWNSIKCNKFPVMSNIDNNTLR